MAGHGTDEADLVIRETGCLPFDFHFQVSGNDVAQLNVIGIIADEFRVSQIKKNRGFPGEKQIRQVSLMKLLIGDADILCDFVKILSILQD